jgi:hypothetical protein
MNTSLEMVDIMVTLLKTVCMCVCVYTYTVTYSFMYVLIHDIARVVPFCVATIAQTCFVCNWACQGTVLEQITAGYLSCPHMEGGGDGEYAVGDSQQGALLYLVGMTLLTVLYHKRKSRATILSVTGG